MQYGLATADHPGLLGDLDGTAPAQLAAILAATTRHKVGSFTRDVSTASGTQAVTGVGFSPKAVVFIAGITSTSAMSVGIDSGSAAIGMIEDNVDGAGTYVLSTSQSIGIATTAGGNAQAHITTLGADGFTVTWTKNGSPTGTATIGYLAFL